MTCGNREPHLFQYSRHWQYLFLQVLDPKLMIEQAIVVTGRVAVVKQQSLRVVSVSLRRKLARKKLEGGGEEHCCLMLHCPKKGGCGCISPGLNSSQYLVVVCQAASFH